MVAAGTDKDMPELSKMILPKLNPMIEIFPAGEDENGLPRWTVYNPVGNSYFRIEWATFECLARFTQVENAAQLKEAVERDTMVRIDADDIKGLLRFLDESGLLAHSMTKQKDEQKQHWLTKGLHSYLFFTIPLIKPQRFLDRTVFLAAPFMTKTAMLLLTLTFIYAVFITLPRLDEFLSTFPQLLSWEGIALGLLIFFGIKVLHELGHAYTATKHDVPVAHMGIAFMVLYPVFYTEASGMWRLQERHRRLQIGAAGIITEFYVATAFLLFWHIAPPGIWQTVSFTVVAITLIGSLFINLNPLMRFDGYYLTSDWTALENLQDRSIAFARWALRKFLFALPDPAPEPDLHPDTQRFLVIFGIAMIIYRFFLFLGIALLVYWMFFKPLGLILMIIELWWFIFRPLGKELAVWGRRAPDIFATVRGKCVSALFVAMITFLFLPIGQSVTMPAVLHAAKFQAIYPSAPARIETLNVSNGDSVKEGNVLALMSSPELEKDILILSEELRVLEQEERRGGLSGMSNAERQELRQTLGQKRIELKELQNRQERLRIVAPFNGVIADMSPQIHMGRNVRVDELLFRVIDRSSVGAEGFVSEQHLTRLKEGQTARFLFDGLAFDLLPLTVKQIDQSGTETLPWAELSSVYGGPLAAQRSEDLTNPSATTLLNSHTRVRFAPTDPTPYTEATIRRGTVIVEAEAEAPILVWTRRALAFIQYELGFNT